MKNPISAILFLSIGLMVFGLVLFQGFEALFPPHAASPKMIHYPNQPPLSPETSFTIPNREIANQPEICKQARELIEQENWDKATNALEKCLSETPHLVETRTLLCISASQMENWDEAIKQCRLALDISPNDKGLKSWFTHVLISRALEHFESNSPDQAALLCQKVLSITSNDESALLLMAKIAEKQGDRLEAAQWLDSSLAIDSTRKQSLIFRANLAEQLNENRKALALYQKVNQLDNPNDNLQPKIDKLGRLVKVDSKKLDINSQRFTLLFDGITQADASSQIMAQLEYSYAEISSRLFFVPSYPITIVLYSADDYQHLMQGPGWMQAAYDGKIRIPIESMSQPDHLKKIIQHELSHAFVGNMSNHRAPVWLDEGLAQLQENRILSSQSIEVLSNSKVWKNLDQLKKPFSSIKDPHQANLLYTQSLYLASYLVDNWGYFAIRNYLVELKEGEDPESRFYKRFGIHLDQLIERARNQNFSSHYSP